MKVYFYTYEIPVTLPTGMMVYKGGRWNVKLWLSSWKRERGDWPRDWQRHRPRWPGPIFRYWRFGPVEVWRFRDYPDKVDR